MLFERKKTRYNTKEDMDAKSHAYNALAEYKITSLPVTLHDIRESKIYISSWQRYFRTDSKPMYFDTNLRNGAVMSLGENSNMHYVIFYDGNLTEPTRNWIIAKLIYYIRSGFADENPHKYITCDASHQAEIFATYFTCPDIVLEECNILSAEDIMEYCQVPFSVAERKARYLKNGHNKFIYSALENLVKEKFELYINNFCKKDE